MRKAGRSLAKILNWALLALGVLVGLTEVFREGSRLRDEADLTV